MNLRIEIMERNNLFYRVAFFLVSCLVATTYEFSTTTHDPVNTFLIGLSKGALIFALISLVEAGVKRISLRSLNTALVGIALGTLLGYVTTSCIHTLFTLLNVKPLAEIASFVTLFTYLGSLYFSIRTTYSAAEVWWLSIPFVQLSPAGQAKKREILLDISAIEDIRLADLARLGILDHQLVIPSFVLKEIQKGMEAQDEAVKTRYRKCFEQIKRLENIQTLGIQQKEFHTSELDDLATKLIRTAKLVQAHILTSEPSALKIGDDDDVMIISIEGIANAIKPSAQRGEILSIKIQRPGKEPKQGVGYLEDGTMVVVNGGGEFLGETIKTQVLSQKYSSSGKIIFCNATPSDEKGNLRLPPDDAIFSSSPYAYSAVSDKKDDAYAPIPRVKRDFSERGAVSDPWNRH